MGEVRDFAADREAAIKETLKQVEAEGGDTSHLKSLLKAESVEFAAIDVPQPMAPGTAVPGQPLSPLPVGQAEPADGSAPDKREQDNAPKKVGGVIVGPKDPGPEAVKSSGKGTDPSAVGDAFVPGHKGNPGVPDQTIPPELTDPPAEPTPAELAKEAHAKDKARDKAEAQPPSAKVDANKAAPILAGSVKAAGGTPEPALDPTVAGSSGSTEAKKAPAKKAAGK